MKNGCTRGRKTPMRRTALPEEMVGAAVFPTSNESNYMTGQVFCEDVGWTSQGRAGSFKSGFMLIPSTPFGCGMPHKSNSVGNVSMVSTGRAERAPADVKPGTFQMNATRADSS